MPLTQPDRNNGPKLTRLHAHSLGIRGREKGEEGDALSPSTMKRDEMGAQQRGQSSSNRKKGTMGGKRLNRGVELAP